MSEEIRTKVNKLVNLLLISGGANLTYEALQDFLIKAEKEGQWDFLLMPLREAIDIVFEIMMIQRGDFDGTK